MNEFQILEFNHKNLKRPTHLVRGMIVAYQYDKTQDANVILTAGGLIFPVDETLEEIKVKIEGTLYAPVAQEIENGRATTVRQTRPLRKREKSTNRRERSEGSR